MDSGSEITSLTQASPLASSFRDPAGFVFAQHGRIYRAITAEAEERFRYFLAHPVAKSLMADGKIVATEIADKQQFDFQRNDIAFVVEHERLPFISYPYEWSFELLKVAALRHLDVQLEALDSGFVLTDATAYNVQFDGPRPVFIDLLSFRPYTPDEPWYGYGQFCEQFLNPLLFVSSCGIPFNAYYKGTLRGISTTELSGLLPATSVFSPSKLVHVFLQARAQRTALSQGGQAGRVPSLPKERYRSILVSLRQWIDDLRARRGQKTVWEDYESSKSYAPGENDAKHAFVETFVRSAKPSLIWDMGCNAGEFSRTALRAGAGRVIGFDIDLGALDAAYHRAVGESLAFLPLYQDALNPSCGAGWHESERAGLLQRANADGVLALALIHHLCIANNVPLRSAVAWIVGVAPAGVIEFVPKSDPMVGELLRWRQDIFPDYSIDVFRDELARVSEIVDEKAVSATGRTMFWFRPKR